MKCLMCKKDIELKKYNFFYTNNEEEICINCITDIVNNKLESYSKISNFQALLILEPVNLPKEKN